MVTEQIANLSTGNRRLGSSPSLSAFFFTSIFSGCSVARLSRLLWEQEVAGSNPATPTNKSSDFSGLFFWNILKNSNMWPKSYFFGCYCF